MCILILIKLTIYSSIREERTFAFTGVEESQARKDDGEIKIREMPKELGIELSEYNIQIAQRLDKKKPLGKPRQIIVRSILQKKNEI